MTDKDNNRKKNPHAVAMGKLGGSAKAKKPKGFAAISAARRRAIAKAGGLTKARNARARKEQGTSASAPKKRKQPVQKDVMTAREIARATGIGLLSIYAMLERGEIPSIKVGKRYYVSGPVYRDWLANFGQPAPQNKKEQA